VLWRKVVLGLLALLLLGWLFRQSTQIDIDLHVRTVQHFEQLREQDARLSRYVLQSRYGLLRNYDPIVATQREVNRVLENLAQDKPEAFAPGDSAIQKAFSEYRNALRKKSDLVESFKSHNAVLGNSLRYFPLAAKQQHERLHASPQHEALLHELLESVLLFGQFPDELTKGRIEHTELAIRQTDMQKNPAIVGLLKHVDVILAFMVDVDDQAREITQSQNNLYADQVFALYNADFVHRDHLARNYRLAMALLAAAMLAYVGWLLTHLQRARDTLASSLRELEFQKHALDAHSIVSIADRTGKILYTNDKFSEISLYSREELLGQDHRLLNSGHHPSDFFKSMWATIGKGHIWQGEVKNRRKDGAFYWVDSTIAPFMDDRGRPVRYVSIRTDITARKESEVSMLQAMNDAENARSVAEQARYAAEQAAKIKGDFLANMSHEIRTPINGIIGFTNLALDTELNTDQREFIGLIKSSADSLLNVINDILDFSKIESGKLEIEAIEFSLEVMLRDTMKSLALRAHQKNLELLLHVAQDVPDRIFGDPGRLRQVLINLIGNAIKFTEIGEIELEVGCPHKDDGMARLRFSVRDTGIGISPDKFQSIFESFSQADTSTTRKYGGTGLGLTISSQIINLMGGRIEVQSAIGGGSTFAFELDLPIVSKNALAHYQETGRIEGMPVLAVDDNATNRKLLGDILHSWKMLPTVVCDGAEALTELQRAEQSGRPYPLILMDMHMPGMDGFELAEKIAAQSHRACLTVMMLTSQGQRGDATRCKQLGIASYLTKPVSQSDLLDAIMTALGEPKGLHSPIITQHSLRETQRKLHLLLADDNAVNQILAVRLLEKLGHTITVANNGKEAIAHWEQGGFDAILMDVDMPEMGGYEATRIIRSREALGDNHIPIIAMTAHAMKGAREECLAQGMDGYVSKPIDTDLLWRELQGLVQNGTAPGNAPSASVLAVVDFAKARRTLDDNQELFEEIVQQYLADAPIHLQTIVQAVAQADANSVRRSAHTLQGMVGIFAAEQALHCAQEVERTAGTAQCAEATQELVQVMNELQIALKSYQWCTTP